MTCQKAGCTNPVVSSQRGGSPARYCSKRCRARAGAARWKAAHPDYQRNWRASGGAALVNAQNRAKTVQRDRDRQRKTPRCMICGTPLTPMQFRRGVTCGGKCAQLRYTWFVRDRGKAAAA